MPILKLTPESSDEHCGLPIFLSKITDENNESTLSMMCGTPLWHGTWGPGWLSPFEIQLIKILSNAITAGSHSCSLAVCSPFMSMLFHHYVTLKYEVWRCFFFFFLQPSADSWNQSLAETLREEEPRIAVPVSKTTDIFSPTATRCNTVISSFISYCMRLTIQLHNTGFSGIQCCTLPLLKNKNNKICNNESSDVV